jgi:hypothetical protein
VIEKQARQRRRRDRDEARLRQVVRCGVERLRHPRMNIARRAAAPSVERAERIASGYAARQLHARPNWGQPVRVTHEWPAQHAEQVREPRHEFATQAFGCGLASRSLAWTLVVSTRIDSSAAGGSSAGGGGLDAQPLPSAAIVHPRNRAVTT